jgi:hypothetical protein
MKQIKTMHAYAGKEQIKLVLTNKPYSKKAKDFNL